MMLELNNHQQEKYDACRKAAYIEKFSDIYRRCQNFKWMVDNTCYFTEAEIHKSMRIAGGSETYDQSLLLLEAGWITPEQLQGE